MYFVMIHSFLLDWKKWSYIFPESYTNHRYKFTVDAGNVSVLTLVAIVGLIKPKSHQVHVFSQL